MNTWPNAVTIVNGEYLDDDSLPLLKECLERAQTHHHVNRVTISLSKRDALEEAPGVRIWNAPGWLEFGMAFEYDDGGKLFVGCIQRKPGAPFEFHT